MKRKGKAMGKVFIIDGQGGDYRRMFQAEGWEVVTSMQEADLVQFTGGSDVSPYLYHHFPHPETRSNSDRDKIEVALFDVAYGLEIPMAGICRGAQFLNVMNGGTMWQHVDGHVGRHNIVDLFNETEYMASSTHHQMMREGPEGLVVGVAFEANVLEGCRHPDNVFCRYIKHDTMYNGDPEVIYYDQGPGFLCFQPHPEFAGLLDLRRIYFNYLKIYLEVE